MGDLIMPSASAPSVHTSTATIVSCSTQSTRSDLSTPTPPANYPVPDTIEDKIDQVVNRRTYMYQGVEYRWDFHSSKYVKIADYRPSSVIRAIIFPESQPGMAQKIKLRTAIRIVYESIFKRFYQTGYQRYYSAIHHWQQTGRTTPPPKPPCIPEPGKRDPLMVYQDQDPPYLKFISPLIRWKYFGREKPLEGKPEDVGFMHFASDKCKLADLAKSGFLSQADVSYLLKLEKLQERYKVDNLRPKSWLSDFVRLAQEHNAIKLAPMPKLACGGNRPSELSPYTRGTRRSIVTEVGCLSPPKDIIGPQGSSSSPYYRPQPTPPSSSSSGA